MCEGKAPRDYFVRYIDGNVDILNGVVLPSRI